MPATSNQRGATLRQAAGGLGAVVLVSFGQALSCLLMLAVWGVAAWQFSPEMFGLYVLSRRGVSLLNGVVACGVFIGLVRLGSSANRNACSAELYLVVAIGIVLTAAGGVALVSVVGSDLLASWCLGDTRHSPLIPATVFAAGGMAMQVAVHGYCLGRQWVGRSVAWQIGPLASSPLVAFALTGESTSVTKNVLVLGWIWTTTALAVVGVVVTRANGLRWRRRELFTSARELLAYGLPRVPGDFMFLALFSFPAGLAAARGDLIVAGVMGLGASVLAMLIMAIRPLAVLLIPGISRLAANGQLTEVRNAVKQAVILVAVAGGGLGLVIATLSPWVIRSQLGLEFAPAAIHLQVLALGAPLLAAFAIVRSALDSVNHRPFATKNVAISLGVLMLLGASGGVPWIATSALLAYTALLALSAYDLHRMLADIGAKSLIH